MRRDFTGYELTMNVEQDSLGHTDYVAVLCTSEIGCHQGRGKEPHLAIIALSQAIIQWDVSRCRKQGGPLFIEQASEVAAEEFRHAFTRAINQPQPRIPIIPMDASVGYHPQVPSVGRIVWYFPVVGEIEDHKGGPLPAFVTRVVDGFNVNLQVILDKEGSRFVPGVDYGGGKVILNGTWVWPAKI